MHVILSVLFGLSLMGIFYAYVGYPILICAMAWAMERWGKSNVPDSLPAVSESDLPEITVLISAYNAEQHIGDRIENLLCCDYPADRLKILVATDGCTDRTADIVRDLNTENVTLFEFTDRCGKSRTLARAMQEISNGVVVFTDASTQFDSSALRSLAGNFVDPSVGFVAGKVSIVDEHGLPSESMYWRSEMMVRQCEAQMGIMLGVSGAIYAVRRELFVEPTRPIINDDMVLPMLVHLKHRCRFVIDTTARAYASNTGGMRAEFQRRCRIGAGGFQSLRELRDLWSWKNRITAAAFVSHKLLRWICPFLLIIAFVSNVALLSESIYSVFMMIQLAAYTMAMIGFVAPEGGIVIKVARIATSFIVMNVALGIGFVRWIFQPDNATWVPTPRARWGELPPVAESQTFTQRRVA